MITFEKAAGQRQFLPPRVKRVVEELTYRINQGRLQSGDQLPTLRQLGQALGVSYGVIHAALRQLETEGLVETVHGSGTYVRRRGQTLVPRRQGSDVYILIHNRRHGFSSALDAMTCALQDQGLMPIPLAFDRFDSERVERLLAMWHEAPPKAVLVRGASRQVAETVQKHSPAITRFIMVYGLLDGTSPHWHCVRPDEFMSHRLAAQYLIEKGHRRIGLPVTAYREMSDNDVQYHILAKTGGIRQAFIDAGLPDGLLIHRKDVPQLDLSNIGLTDENVNATAQWMRAPEGPTGIIENCYRMPYVNVALRQAGMQAGKDIGLVGIGDPSPAHQGEYSVVSEQFDLIAQEVASMVQCEDEDFDRLGRQVVIPPALVPVWQPKAASGAATASADVSEKVSSASSTGGKKTNSAAPVAESR